jgi:hypothetical protein
MMVLPNSTPWEHHLERTLGCYDDLLLRETAAKLLKPRGQWPAADLVQRCIGALGNAVMVDRRLGAQSLASRRLLALMGHSGQPRWKMGGLLEMLAALGHADGPAPVLALFEAGLLFPDLSDTTRNGSTSLPPARHLKSFEQWLGHGTSTSYQVFTLPFVLSRAIGEDLGIPVCAPVNVSMSAPREADGLEWPLRLAVVWQQLQAGPLRRTQQADFFKRDLDRLRADPILSASPAECLAHLPDLAMLAVALAQTQAVAQHEDGVLRAGTLPASWDEGSLAALSALWAALPLLDNWNAQSGWTGSAALSNPFPSAYLLCLLYLARQPPAAWISPADVETWVLENHPYWKEDGLRPSRQRSWIPAFLLGLCYQLRLLQAAGDSTGQWAVRLAPLARWLMGFTGEPPRAVSYSQTLLVQPNLQIVLYRQGATLDLIAKLSRFAAWKVLGAACTLQLEAEGVYRALESGQRFDAILQILEQYAMKAVPPAVVESLRTWADKRERITVYPAATLFEFASATDLHEALARGLPGIRLSDRLLAVASESEVDFSDFRLTGTRDYALPPEKCVEIGEDGVTLAVDQSRSDLLLETETQRFAEAVDLVGVSGKRRYRLTPESLAAARQAGLGVQSLQDWFQRRSGQALSPAARLLMNGCNCPAPSLKSRLILQVSSAEMADGLVQWPQTRDLIEERLGPTVLAVAANNVETLRQRLDWLGTSLESLTDSLPEAK